MLIGSLSWSDTYENDGYNPEAPSITNTSRPTYRHRVNAQRPNLIGLTMGDVDQPQRGIMFHKKLANLSQIRCFKMWICCISKQEQGCCCHFCFCFLKTCSVKTDLLLFICKQERFQTTVWELLWSLTPERGCLLTMVESLSRNLGLTSKEPLINPWIIFTPFTLKLCVFSLVFVDPILINPTTRATTRDFLSLKMPSCWFCKFPLCLTTSPNSMNISASLAQSSTCRYVYILLEMIRAMETVDHIWKYVAAGFFKNEMLYCINLFFMCHCNFFEGGLPEQQRSCIDSVCLSWWGQAGYPKHRSCPQQPLHKGALVSWWREWRPRTFSFTVTASYTASQGNYFFIYIALVFHSI